MSLDGPLTERDVVLHLSDRTGVGLVLVSKVLDALDELLEQSLEDGRSVKLGSMNVEHVTRSARSGRNPQTGETIEIPAHGAVKITPSAALKRAARKAEVEPQA